MRRQSGGGEISLNLRYREINVLRGMNVTYSDRTLNLIDVLDGKVIEEKRYHS